MDAWHCNVRHYDLREIRCLINHSFDIHLLLFLHPNNIYAGFSSHFLKRLPSIQTVRQPPRHEVLFWWFCLHHFSGLELSYSFVSDKDLNARCAATSIPLLWGTNPRWWHSYLRRDWGRTTSHITHSAIMDNGGRRCLLDWRWTI